MRYENSLTSSVQSFIADTLAQKIAAAESGWDISGTAKDVRRHLCDPSTVNTSSFVIRRFIQANHAELLPRDVDLPDLTKNSNVPWPEEVNEAVAKALAAHAREQGIGVTKKEWKRYLDGCGVSKREKAFMIAFALQMGVDDTMDLLLSFDMEPYSVRYPLDLVCLFCQHTPGKYGWAEAMGMLDTFMEGRTSGTGETPAPTVGMTRQIASELKDIFTRNLPNTDEKEALTTYMVQHSGEFVSFSNAGKQVFLPGYSLTRMEMFMRLAEYLTILYPEYDIFDEKDPEKRVTRRMEPGAPSLSFLARSMFFGSEWKDIIWPDQADAASPSGKFEDSMRTLCQNYEQHMMAVERLRKGGKSVAFFDRRDALLFIYFLIDGYRKLADSNSPEARQKYAVIDEMLNSGEDFDYAIAEMLEKVDYIFEISGDEDTVAQRFSSLVQCFDLILSQMEYMNLYLPAPFDRFVALSLLSAAPEELTPLIMCQDELDYFDSVLD